MGRGRNSARSSRVDAGDAPATGRNGPGGGLGRWIKGESETGHRPPRRPSRKMVTERAEPSEEMSRQRFGLLARFVFSSLFYLVNPSLNFNKS